MSSRSLRRTVTGPGDIACALPQLHLVHGFVVRECLRSNWGFWRANTDWRRRGHKLISLIYRGKYLNFWWSESRVGWLLVTVFQTTHVCQGDTGALPSLRTAWLCSTCPWWQHHVHGWHLAQVLPHFLSTNVIALVLHWNKLQFPFINFLFKLCLLVAIFSWFSWLILILRLTRTDIFIITYWGLLKNIRR